MELKRILAIEDEIDILDLYTYIFTDAGYEFSGSVTGENIFTQIETFRPDLVMLDINLGALSGSDLCRAIKSDPQTSQITVVLVSGETQTVQLMEYTKANGFIAKPFDLDYLLSRVAELLTPALA
jgi:DNA-binding response OmpR family regulator